MGRIQEAIKKAKADGRNIEERSGIGRLQSTLDSAKGDGPPSEVGERTFPQSHVLALDEDHLWESRVIAASEQDERVGAYRQLRTQILKLMRQNQWTTLAITSAHEDAGKTLTAANLAISLARDVNTTVLLVDLDLKEPTIHQILNLKSDQGLVDFLEGRVELADILYNPGVARLTVLVGRSAGKYSSELLASPRMKTLMRDIRQHDHQNITIFDLPPLLRNDDAMLFTPYTDATLLIVEDGVTTEDELRRSLHLLKDANVVGTILNKARI